MADYFERMHSVVLRKIDELLEHTVVRSLNNFVETPQTNVQNGQTYREFEMTRDGFTLLAMGFTGKKALQFKLRYIEQFNAMEAKLKGQAQPAAITATEGVASCLKEQSEITPHLRKSLRRETTIDYHPLKERPRRGRRPDKGEERRNLIIQEFSRRNLYGWTMVMKIISTPIRYPLYLR